MSNPNISIRHRTTVGEWQNSKHIQISTEYKTESYLKNKNVHILSVSVRDIVIEYKDEVLNAISSNQNIKKLGMKMSII
jgi:hypothetical protein